MILKLSGNLLQMADIKEDANSETLNKESRKQYSDEELNFLD